MSSDEIRERTQRVWDRKAIWWRSSCTPTLRARIAFVFPSKLYRQMYAGSGISTDSARRKKSKSWARWTARQCKKLFQAERMPELVSPQWDARQPAISGAALAGLNTLPGPFFVLPED